MKIELTKEEDISAYYRGKLIQQTIDLELRLDLVIARFLSMSNQDRVLDIIEIFDIVEIGLFSKSRILQFIVKKYFIEFIDLYPTLFEDLRNLIEHRNVLAHRRPENELKSHVKLSWAKTTKKGIGKKELFIDEVFYNKFKNNCAEMYIKIIELEVKIILWGDKKDENPEN